MVAVTSFKYVGLTMASFNDDWPEVKQNLWREQVKWGRLVKLFGREGANSIMEGRLYVALVQAVILFGLETWVMTPFMEISLKGFHHRAIRRMSGMGPKRQCDRTWV